MQDELAMEWYRIEHSQIVPTGNVIKLKFLTTDKHGFLHLCISFLSVVKLFSPVPSHRDASWVEKKCYFFFVP